MGSAVAARNQAGIRLRVSPWVGLLVAALALYAALGLYQLKLPGLYYDEALDAVPAMQVLRGQPLDIEATFALGGHQWPLMVMSYVGPTTSYLVLPVFALLGVSVTSLRLFNWCLGLVALLLSWGFLRAYLDQRVASIAVLLLALDPTFICWVRLGAFVSLPMLPLSIAALWCLYRWYRTSHGRDLAIAAFCLGLGLTTKLLFVWLWAGLALAWLVVTPWLGAAGGPRGWQAWRWPLQRAGRPTLALAAAALLAGLAPLILYNLQSRNMLALLLDNAIHTQQYGVNNLDVLHNMRQVILGDLPAFLRGTWFDGIFGGPDNPVAVPAFLVSLAGLLYAGVRSRLPYSARRLGVLALLLLAIVLQSAFTVTGLGPTHLMILWPLPQALIATALVVLLDLSAAHFSNASRLSLAGLVLVVLLTGEVSATWRSREFLTRVGGRGSGSDSIYALAQDLAQSAGARPVIALDWGFRRSIQLLTEGQIDPEERFYYSAQPGEDFLSYIDRRVQEGPAIYLFHSPGYTVYGGRWDVFEQAAYRHRLTPVLARNYYQRDGQLVAQAYGLEPLPVLFSAPAMQHPVGAMLGNGLSLLGYDIVAANVMPGDTWRLMLYWRTSAVQQHSYKVFVHVVDDSGTAWAQSDNIPQYWGYPTDRWQAGEVVPDPVRITIPAEMRAGSYHVFAGMYDASTGQRLPILLNGQRQAGDTLELTQLTVVAP